MKVFVHIKVDPLCLIKLYAVKAHGRPEIYKGEAGPRHKMNHVGVEV
jgi:hypothetical protein